MFARQLHHNYTKIVQQERTFRNLRVLSLPDSQTVFYCRTLFVREDGSLGDISVDAEGGREGKMLLSVLTDGDLDLPLEQASNCISWKPSMLLGFRIVFESNFLPLALSVASLVPLVPRDIAEDDPDFIILSTASPVKINNH